MKRTLVAFLAAGLISFAGLSQQFDKAKLDAYIDTLANNNRFMGSVAVSNGKELIYTKSVGFADIEQGLKANENSKYRIGSISKTFTAVLVLKAIEENKLDLSQTIDKYFPEILNADKITITHLLYHRSGIHNFPDEKTWLEWNTQPKTEQEIVEMIIKGGSDFEPDAKTSYSNSNFMLLSYILEKIYRKPYSAILEEKIIKPIGLKNTYYGKKIEVMNNECNSYAYMGFTIDTVTNTTIPLTSDAGNWKIVPETDMSIFSGAGSIVSTPIDLTIFSEALFKFLCLQPQWQMFNLGLI